MIFLFCIKNAWLKKTSLKYLFFRDYIISENKSLEIEVISGSDNLISIEMDFRISGRDHAGASICFSIFGFEINFRIYDHRHWDYKNNTWLNEFPYDY